MFAILRDHWFKLLLVGYVLYASAFVYQSSEVVRGQRYFLLFDDAMISMTYARNLAHGEGPVWFPSGERVEGFSNPLWMLYMAAVHLLPLSPAKMALPIQLTGIALIGATMYFVKRTTEEIVAERLLRERKDASPRPKWSSFALAPAVAVLLTALYFPLNNWTLRGMEVGLLAFGMALAVWAALECQVTQQYPRWLFPWLGLLTTVRLDAALASGIIVLWLAWTFPARRSRILVVGFGWILLFVIAQLLIQRAYYGDWLPNTYYLKLSGIPLERRVLWGAYALWCFLKGFGLWLIALVAIYLAGARSKRVALLVALIVGQAGYSIYVGGDSWEWWGGANRYVCVAIPMAFILIALTAAMIGDWFARLRADGRPAVAGGVMLTLSAIALVQVNAFEFYTFNSLAAWALCEKPLEVSEHFEVLNSALIFKDATTPQARIAVTWAGIIPYFSERPAIDLLGKNDRHVARGPDQPIDPPPLQMFELAPVPYFWPGHCKRDYEYSILQLQPDIVQLWHGMNELEAVLFERYELANFGAHQFLVKKGSKEIKSFEKAKPQRKP